jgi:hypothetical protein
MSVSATVRKRMPLSPSSSAWLQEAARQGRLQAEAAAQTKIKAAQLHAEAQTIAASAARRLLAQKSAEVGIVKHYSHPQSRHMQSVCAAPQRCAEVALC